MTEELSQGWARNADGSAIVPSNPLNQTAGSETPKRATPISVEVILICERGHEERAFLSFNGHGFSGGSAWDFCEGCEEMKPEVDAHRSEASANAGWEIAKMKLREEQGIEVTEPGS